MEKTAAGVYTNSPTGAVASTASTMEKQKKERWEGDGSGMLGAKWGEQLSLVGYSIGSKRNDRNEWRGVEGFLLSILKKKYIGTDEFLNDNTSRSYHRVLYSIRLEEN